MPTRTKDCGPHTTFSVAASRRIEVDVSEFRQVFRPFSPRIMRESMAILTVPSGEELSAFAAEYPFGSLEKAEGIEAGTVNTSYRLSLADGVFFLRIYEEQGEEGARREGVLLSHLASSGVVTPRPLPGRDGAAVRFLAGKPAVLFPWVTGGVLCQKAVTPAAAKRVGAALAQLHEVGAPAGVVLGPGRFGPADLALRCERVAVSVDAEARLLAAPLERAVLAAASERRSDLPTGLVHGDLFRDNVLWHEGRIAALLDFESAHDGPFVYDLAVTILSWCFDSSLRTDLARAVVAGYREVRELDAAEREGLYTEAVLATLRFTITRITDDAIRVGKRWQRFVARREAIERVGPRAFAEVLGL